MSLLTSEEVCLVEMESKNDLRHKIESNCKITLPNELNESVLYTLWQKNNYNALYNCEGLNELTFIQKAKLEGFIDKYFNNNKQIHHSNNAIELTVNNQRPNQRYSQAYGDIPINNNNNAICGNPCMDCCEDMLEHAVCCNCNATIYDYWHDGITIDVNNQPVIVSKSMRKQLKKQKIKDDPVYGCCYNPCEDCCEDILEHAICCNCYAYIVSHWFEAADIDEANSKPLPVPLRLSNNAPRNIKYNNDFEIIKQELNKNFRHNNDLKNYLIKTHQKKRRNCKRKIICLIKFLITLLILCVLFIVSFIIYRHKKY